MELYYCYRTVLSGNIWLELELKKKKILLRNTDLANLAVLWSKLADLGNLAILTLLADLAD